ncbi:hypothetical protein [Streptomyces halstedii]|uniref:Uncharacterized protein n=1 Tax=Streptomyces halstedii TaxID=1944 RepID=A0A6N9U6R4_STRHA|nr:hypothetical protein [Streptomyces halstedii]NEA19328.1 hypothetical protein [Streptomyces halstedii]
MTAPVTEVSASSTGRIRMRAHGKRRLDQPPAGGQGAWLGHLDPRRATSSGDSQ